YVSSGNDVNLVPQVVKRQQPVKKHQHAVREIEIIVGIVADMLQLADNIVRAKSDRSRSEWRQARHVRGLMLLKQFLGHMEDIPFPLLALLPPLDGNFAATSAQLHIGAGAEERISPDVFSSFDGLKKECVFLLARNC